MDDNVLNILQIAISLVSVAVMLTCGILVIKPLIDHKKETKIKNIEKKLEEFNEIFDETKSRLFVMLAKTNIIENSAIQKMIKDKNSNDNYRMKNNFGIFYLEKSRKIDPTVNPELHKDYLKTAVSYFNAALKQKHDVILDKRSNIDIVHVNLADAYDDMNETLKAIKECKIALKINDKCSQAYNMLASIYLDNQNLSDAEKFAKKSLEINRTNGYAFLTLAEIYITKDYPKYKDKIERLLRLSLINGCPVWDYINSKTYFTLMQDSAKWPAISEEIDKYRQIYTIAGNCLKSEYEYII